MDAIQADGLQVVERGAHAHRFSDGGRAGFELVGQASPSAVVEVDVLDHFAAAQERGHRLQQRLTAPKETHTRGAAELMGTAHQEIRAELLHVYRQVRQALAGIHQHQSTGRVGQGRHLGDRVEAAEGVAHLHKAHEPSALSELAAQVVQIQLTGVSEAGVAQHTAGAIGQQLPGHQVAVVLHHREQHLITGAQVRLTPAAGHQVDRLAGVAGEHDLVGVRCTNEGRRLSAGSFKAFRGAGAQLVRAAMHVGVVVVVVMLQRLKHLARLLAGGGVIEIDQRLAEAGGLGQQRKIRTRQRRQVVGLCHSSGLGYREGAGHAAASSKRSSEHQLRAAAGSSRSTSSQKARCNRAAA